MTATMPALRDPGGDHLDVPASRWFDAASAAEVRALADVRGPVLDIGCGPGRHVLALAQRGIPSLGIDITAAALRHARAKRVPVLERCVFGRVPGAGRWHSALLLDGNVGIGGDPVLLLQRVRELLASDGRVLVETDATRTAATDLIRFDVDATPGPWFGWTAVAAAELPTVAHGAGFQLGRRWIDDGRHFAWLCA